jgi:hypothetical protein
VTADLMLVEVGEPTRQFQGDRFRFARAPAVPQQVLQGDAEGRSDRLVDGLQGDYRPFHAFTERSAKSGDHSGTEGFVAWTETVRRASGGRQKLCASGKRV